MHRTRICLGVAVAVAAGLLLWYAWDEPHAPREWTAAVSTAAVLLLICSGIYLHIMRRQQAAAKRPAPEFAADRPPLLGVLLVHKYRLISPEALARALAVQRETKKLLGEVLLSMGELTPGDLEMVLRDQAGYRNGAWRGEPWARRQVRAPEGGAAGTDTQAS